MLNSIEKYPILSLTVFVVIMLGFTVDSIPVTIMEARNFISAREMLSDNNWILTTMNGEARYEKPPLPTWITAGFGYVFGMTSVLALRWPTLLFLIAIGVTIYLFSKQLGFTKSHSLVNGFIVLTSFYVIGITIEAPWDIYTHSFMLMALYQLFVMLQNKKTLILRSLLFVIFISSSILSKGPVSLYVLFLSFAVAYGITFKFKGGIVHYLKLIALLIFGIVLGGWWYLHVRLVDPETFARIASKETSNWSSYNVRPFYYYWSFFVQSGIWTVAAFISLLYPYMKTRVKHLKAYKFSLFWTLFAVILLSIIPEKKSRYLMPVLIPLAINIGFYVDYLIREFKNLQDKKETFPVYFQFGIVGCIGVLFWVIWFFSSSVLNGFVAFRFILTAMVLLTIGSFIFYYLKKKRIKNVFYLIIAFMMSLGLLALPIAKIHAPLHYKSISKMNTGDLKVYSLNYVAPEAIYNYGEKIPTIKAKEGYYIPKETSFLLFTHKINPKTNATLAKLYNIEFVDTYDLNTSAKSSKNYRDRLVNTLYKLTQKRND